VSLKRDWQGARDFSEYIVTPAVRSIADQILSELARTGGTRAWSLTGPYGTGKSAFALFLADILGAKRPGHDEGRALRAQHFPRRRPMVQVLLQADRAPLLPELAGAFASEFKSISKPFATKAARLAKIDVDGEQVAALMLEASAVATKNGFAGVAVIVDEFGKFLEHAADHPAEADVYALQQIAEAASRSSAPVLFATILHSGFADYIGNRDELRKAEWQKVQGRFRDIPFQLPGEQLLALLAHAIEGKLTNGIGDLYTEKVARILRDPALTDVVKHGGAGKLLPACLPLHPVTALILWPLFRSKVAQNERSLFAFLTSHEPYGFQEFLERSEASNREAPLYGLPDLYEYVKASLGLSAYSGSDSRRWALVDFALERVPASAPTLASEIVKSIGLLAQYGSAAGVRPSRVLLELCTGVGEEFDEALRLLEGESIVVYRRHSDSYSLWEGSDFDLEGACAEARSRLLGRPVHERLANALELRSAVARAHYVKTGTLRFFEARVVGAGRKDVDRVLKEGSQADGFVLFVADSSGDGAARARQLSRTMPEERPTMVAAPRVAGALISALEEWECWRWVRDHVKELEGDPVARQEVGARLEQARDDFERLAGPVFGLAGHALDPTESVWFYKGREKNPKNARGFQELLSSICEEVFPKAPVLKNELLNRQNLSSAAARARRNLLEHMVEDARKKELGIEGYPPECSMYRALLVEGGFHKGRGERWWLRPPDKAGWAEVWKAIEDFLAGATRTRRPIVELIDALRAPPYGVRNGPMPVLIAAALLVKGNELALYEDGVFVPDTTTEVLERLTRRPETFEIQSYRLSTAEKKVLAALSQLVQTAGGEDALLSVAKWLVRIAAALPPYVKQTRNLEPETIRVREALLNATDPKALIFSELPDAVGMKVTGSKSAADFAARLLACTKELSRGYGDLLELIEKEIRAAFAIDARGEKARGALRERCRPLVAVASDPRLQVFVREAAREDERDWREVLGRAIRDGKPPTHWRDDDVARVGLSLRALVTEFDRLHELVDASEESVSSVVSIGVLENGKSEERAVISCPADHVVEADQVARTLRDALDKSAASDQVKLLAAVEVVRDLFATRKGEG